MTRLTTPALAAGARYIDQEPVRADFCGFQHVDSEIDLAPLGVCQTSTAKRSLCV